MRRRRASNKAFLNGFWERENPISSHLPKPLQEKVLLKIWLGCEQHHHEYEGQWIALNEGDFLGSNSSFVELRSPLKNAGQLNIALFINLKIEL